MKTSRETHAGRRRAPDLFGLERAALYPIAGSWTVAAMLLTVLHLRLGLSWGQAGLLTAVPAGIVTVAALLLVQGKPRGYFTDWCEEHLLGRADYDDVKGAVRRHASR